MTIHPLTEWIISNSVVAIAIALLALLSSRMFRSPALTHVLWLLVLIKLITPPLFRVPVEVSREVQISPQAVVTAVVDENILSALPLKEFQESRLKNLVSTEQILFAIWFIGSLAWLLLAGYRSWKFNRKLKRAQRMDREGLQFIEEIGRQLKLKTLPDFMLVEGKVPPLLWSFGGKATVAVPSGLWCSLAPKEQQTLLAHELAHYKRRDHWYRWGEWAMTAVLWWHPLVWFARLGLRKAEEDSCDAWVLWVLPNGAKHYASAILKTLDFLSKRPSPMPTAACGFAERRSFKNVKDRFTTILKHKPSHTMNKKQKSFSIALAVLALPLSGYLLQSQVVAQEDEGPAESEAAEREVVRQAVEVKTLEQTAEIQAVESAVEQRLVRLEKMVQQLVESQETRRSREVVLPKDPEQARDILARQQARMEQQRLHMEHSSQQLQLARREAEIERARMEAELARKQSQLDHAKQQYDSGIINEQDLQRLQHETQMAELEAEQRKVKAESHHRNLEMQLRHQELQLKELERDQDQKF